MLGDQVDVAIRQHPAVVVVVVSLLLACCDGGGSGNEQLAIQRLQLSPLVRSSGFSGDLSVEGNRICIALEGQVDEVHAAHLHVLSVRPGEPVVATFPLSREGSGLQGCAALNEDEVSALLDDLVHHYVDAHTSPKKAIRFELVHL